MAEGVIGDDDENVEAWYLLAFSLFRLKKYATAEECCTNVRNLIIKLKIVDADLEAGTLEIYQEILKHKTKSSQNNAAKSNNQEDEEWATDSEEDVDGDEDADEEMKE